jgi:hypothetical protein
MTRTIAIRTSVSIAAVVVLAGSSQLLARGIPTEDALSYYGVLRTADGAALEGAHEIRVELWDADAGGERACTAEPQSIETPGGRFNVLLPDSCAAAVSGNRDLWAAVSVDGAELPRAKLGAVPYAIEAGNAVRADSAAQADRAEAASGSLQARIDSLEARLAALEDAPAPAPGIRGDWVIGPGTGLPVGQTPTTTVTAEVSCPAGRRPIAGGCDAHHGAYAVWASTITPNGWLCRANPTRTTAEEHGPLEALVFCAE